VVGRRTFEVAPAAFRMAEMRVFVFARTLRPHDYPDVSIVGEDAGETLAAPRTAPGKDIRLFGGGSLFHNLLDPGLVDTVEVAVMPVLRVGGIPLLPPPASRTRLEPLGNKVSRMGIVSLEYAMK
jgi:dihydrofolate reductase